VTQDLRRTGIGRKLFAAVAREAKEAGAKRFKWQVLEWNEPAIAFYKKIGAQLDSEWINCNMTEEQILNYIGE
jgi:GNAT superfamily N-acetyltransferase